MTCSSGYTLTTTYSCTSCPSNCQSCLSSTFCLTCSTNYAVVSGVCVACLSPCKTCQSPNYCISCQTSYYLSAGSCSQCISNCLSCTDSNFCLQCSSGYFFDGKFGDTVGLACTTCMSNCANCTQATSCSKCSSGYYMEGGVCVECTSGKCTCAAVQAYAYLFSYEHWQSFHLLAMILIALSISLN